MCALARCVSPPTGVYEFNHEEAAHLKRIVRQKRQREAKQRHERKRCRPTSRPKQQGGMRDATKARESMGVIE